MRLSQLELEPEYLWLVLFGPGFGESILLAIPGSEQEWVAIDSLRDQSVTADWNPALTLLKNHGAELSAAILTHPHRDHVKGFVQLLDRLRPGAPLGCLGTHLIEEPRRGDDADGVFDRDSAKAALNRIRDTWRDDSDCRWNLKAGTTREVAEATLEVIHPRIVPSSEPADLNTISTPILLDWRETRLLLGADLPSSGWRKVEREYEGAALLSSTDGLKASHHGSAPAQHKVAIGEPPQRERICALTPFALGSVLLPDYTPKGGVTTLLKSHAEIRVTSVPPAGRGKTVPPSALVPAHKRFGNLDLELDPPPASPSTGWVAVAFGARGEVIEIRQGDAAGVVVNEAEGAP